MKKIISDLTQLRQKKKGSVFQNIVIYVLYFLFNSFGSGEKPLLFNKKKTDQLKLQKWLNVSKEGFNEILSTITKI